MLSGTGLATEKGRCYELYMKLKLCEAASPIAGLECREDFEDLHECLWRQKEVSSGRFF